MSKFIITKDFFDIFPQAEFAVVLAKNLEPEKEHNLEVQNSIKKNLKESNKIATKYLSNDVLSENQVIAVWREAYRKFKTKKGARSSIESMLRRISKGNEIGSIIPLVDIYNTISLKYGIPCGGEDIDTMKGDMILTVAEGGEPFRPLGASEDDNTLPGEVIYKDDIGAVCRCWNWREGERTMLTEDTKNAFLIVESVDPERHEDFVTASLELSEMVKRYIKCSAELHFLNKSNFQIDM